MIELKVGDKITIKGYTKLTDSTPGCSYAYLDSSDDILGTAIIESVVKNKVFFYFCEKSSLKGQAHRKQCRRLVKMRNCDACEGIGEINCGIGINRDCQECNGKGKAKHDYSTSQLRIKEPHTGTP